MKPIERILNKGVNQGARGLGLRRYNLKTGLLRRPRWAGGRNSLRYDGQISVPALEQARNQISDLTRTVKRLEEFIRDE